MGARTFAALVFFCVGVLVVSAPAIAAERTHARFAASTYEEENTTKEVDPSVLPDSQVDQDVPSPKERYPHGYPGTKHFYNTTTGMYETLDNETTEFKQYDNSNPDTQQNITVDPNETNVTERYPHGYYPKSEYTNSQTVKTTGAQFTSVDAENETTTFHDRYSAGYPKSLTTKPVYEEQTQQETRYQYGYYRDSEYAGSKPPEKTTTSFTSTQYTTDPSVTPQERYPYGYYPKSVYAGTTPEKTISTKYANFDSETDTEPSERYPHGYFPKSRYSSGPQSQSYSSALGNFDTLPYPNAGVPFDTTGGGCRTAYWVSHIANWPSFFTVESTVGDAFGTTATEFYGDTTILQALMTYKTDPYSQLIRSGCTAILNSYTRGLYKLSHMKVVEQFNAALSTKTKAAAQYLVFEEANVDSIAAGNACR